METQRRKPARPHRWLHLTWIAILAWTLIIGLSLAWNAHNENRRVIELAKAEARANLRKDKAFRLWATAKGGFYIPVSEHTQPSPYLAGLPSRDIRTMNGITMTLFNPATVIKEIGEQFQELSGVQARITNRAYLNPQNAPDRWELKALDAFDTGAQEIAEVTKVDGKAYLRLAHPMKMEQGCLKCHKGTPGQIGGSTGVLIPLAPYQQIADGATHNLAASHGAIWTIGLGLIGFLSFRTRKYESERTVADNELRKLSRAVEASASAIVITNDLGEIKYVNSRFCEMTGYSANEIINHPYTIIHSKNADQVPYHKMLSALQAGDEWRGELEIRKKDGKSLWCHQSVSSIRNEAGEITHFVGVLEDISERKIAEETIMRLADFDSLTQLPNRRLFIDRLEQEIKKANRSGLPIALIFIDLDRFKEVNDSLGHDMGDRLLVEAAKRLLNCVREADTVARLGGDEFTIILGELDDPGSVERITQEVLRKLAEPFRLADEMAYVSASVGVTFYPADATEIDSLLKNADQAMYAAKNAGRNRCHYFTSSMQEAMQMRVRMTGYLRKAISDAQLVMYYQPIVALDSGKIQKAEALLRWQHPKLGLVNPEDFISIAEDTGMIIDIGNWVFQEVVRQVSIWRQSLDADFQISLNKSPVQFHENSTPHSDWIRYLQDHALPGKSIVIEITESLLLNTDNAVTQQLLAYRDAGIQVSLDDFGTGYSSLSYLKKLDIDYIKIDRSFVCNLAPESDDMVLCEAIIVMAHKLGLKVVAEGVETREQCELLRKAGCDLGQGFFFSEPIPSDQFEMLPDLKSR